MNIEKNVLCILSKDKILVQEKQFICMRRRQDDIGGL